MNLEKAVNHSDTLVPAKNQKPVFAFASRRVAVVNVFESVDLQPGRLKIKRVSYTGCSGGHRWHVARK
jgi:hypothetical protein